MNSVKKYGKRSLYIFAILILLVGSLKWLWMMSGSGEWVLKKDEGGVQVYSLKSPGHNITQFKSVMESDMTVTQVAASLLLENHSLENCKKWIPTCVGDVVVEPYSENSQGDSILWTLELLPPVFKNREFLIRTQAAQDPDTKVVSVDITAASGKLPRNDCCLRVTQAHNRWTLTPLDSGKIRIELIQDTSMGGFFPDFLINLAGADEAHKLFKDLLPGIIGQEQYRTAELSYVDE